MPTEVYRGFIDVRSHGDSDDVLFLGDRGAPLAELIEADIERHGRYLTVRYYVADQEQTATEIQANAVRTMLGVGDARFRANYSEITGYLWTDQDLKVGGHDLLAELESARGRFCHLEIDYCQTPANRAQPVTPTPASPTPPGPAAPAAPDAEWLEQTASWPLQALDPAGCVRQLARVALAQAADLAALREQVEKAKGNLSYRVESLEGSLSPLRIEHVYALQKDVAALRARVEALEAWRRDADQSLFQLHAEATQAAARLKALERKG